MAFRLPKRGEDPAREVSQGPGPRAPKGTQLAGPITQDTRSMAAMLDQPLGDLIRQNQSQMNFLERMAAIGIPAEEQKKTLRQHLLEGGVIAGSIRPKIEARMKDMGLTPKHLDDALKGAPPPAEKPKAAEAPKAPPAAAPPVAAPAAPVTAPAKQFALPPAAPPPVAATGTPTLPLGEDPVAPAGPSETPPATAPAAPAAAAPTAVPNRMDAYKRGIAGIESGGNYGSLGKVLKNGDQALGKYQIMASNLPQWSKEALGQPITREQFLKSPELQDKIFEHRFGSYVQKYGEEGAARAWYAGEGGMKNLGATDIHGRLTVADYGKDFARRLGDAPSDTVAENKAPALTGYGGIGSDTIASERAAADTAVASSSGGIGSDAARTGEGSTTAVADSGGFDFGKASGNVGDAFAGIGEMFAKSAQGSRALPSTPANATMASLPQPSGPFPMVDPKQAEMQRQQLAMALQRLNSGKLV